MGYHILLLRNVVNKARKFKQHPHGLKIHLIGLSPGVQWLPCFISHLLLYVHHFCLDQVDCHVLCIVSQFAFRGLLQLLLWYGLWIIVEGHNGTCSSLNSTVIWWMTVSWTIMPHLLFLYNTAKLRYTFVQGAQQEILLNFLLETERLSKFGFLYLTAFTL